MVDNLNGNNHVLCQVFIFSPDETVDDLNGNSHVRSGCRSRRTKRPQDTIAKSSDLRAEGGTAEDGEHGDTDAVKTGISMGSDQTDAHYPGEKLCARQIK